MGQEISQPNKCNIGRRYQQQQQQQPLHLHQNSESFRNSNEEQTILQNNWTSLSSISSNRNKNEEQQKHTLDQPHQQPQHQQKPHHHHHHHHHHHQQSQPFFRSATSYDRPTANKQLSLLSNASATSDYQNVSVTSSSSCGSGNVSYNPQTLYYDKLYKKASDISGQLSYVQLRQHQRKNSQGTDSGIYCTSSVSSTCRCSSSSATSTCGSTAGSSSTTSNKSFDKQKSYLSNHLYIKSYLDILEEDEKASAHFKPARPGIRNYTPKILTDSSAGIGASLSTSAPVGASVVARKPRSKIKDDPWI